MKKSGYLTRALILLLFFGSSIFSLQAQNIGFNPRETQTIQGDVQIIANAIIGLDGVQSELGDGIDYDPNGNYNGGSANDALTVDYIDIDTDGSTFSSSSADFFANGSCSRVVYAGLYWSATYYTEKDSNNGPVLDGLPLPDPRPDFRTIKFKPPGAANYTDITVTDANGVIYDGYRNTLTNPTDSATNDVPYTCYADVTSIVLNNAIANGDNADGTYTVANVRSTIGETQIGNGASAGWILVIMYEDPTLTTKQLSTQDGFIEIDGSTDETFFYDNFQTIPTGPVRAKFGIGALEGDYGIPGDGLAIEGSFLGFPVTYPLSSTPVNTTNNFFNSSISIPATGGVFPTTSVYNTARNPASENTLGFDADIFNIANSPNNQVIPNDATEVEFTASTSGDRYRIFLNAFAIDVLEPELQVQKRVLDINGVDITNGSVNLNDEIFYELTVQNVGNEDILNASIRDIIPANVDFRDLTTITVPAGVTVTFDTGDPATAREVIFSFDDDIVERLDASFTIRFGARLVATCLDLRDACSEFINNQAFSTFTGEDSGTTIPDQGSIFNIDICGFTTDGPSPFIANFGDCDGNFPQFACTLPTTITAGGGFPRYIWHEGDCSGPIVQDSADPTLIVTAAGDYCVEKTGNPDCADKQETWTVTAFTSILHPIVVPLADNVNVCPSAPDNANNVAEIYLCGASDERVLDLTSSLAGATSVIWQELAVGACPGVVRDPDCPTNDPSCEASWMDIATGTSYTARDAGEFRIVSTFPGNCEISFYFNVFKNEFNPTLAVVNDIICSTPGVLEVQTTSNAYEYQLVTPSGGLIGYQASKRFGGLTEQGTYTVNVRQLNVPVGFACVYTASTFLDELNSVVNVTADSPTCPGSQGSIVVTVTDGDINYTYNLSSTTGTFTASEGPTTDASYTFTGLDPDLYDLEVLSYDDVDGDGNPECVDTRQVEILDAPDFSAVAVVTQDLSCTDATIEVTVTGGSSNLVYTIQGDPTSTQSSNIFTIDTAGTYIIIVSDVDATPVCDILTNPVMVNPYESLAATATPSAPDCPGELGEILVTVTSGTANGPFDYILDGGTPVINIAATSYTFTGVGVGPHSIEVLDRFDCPVTVTATISDAVGITANIDITQDYKCTQSGTVTVSNTTGGTGSYTYILNGDASTSNTTGIFTGLSDGSYSVTITDSNSCPVTVGPVTIEALQEVTDLTFSSSQVQCPALESTITLGAIASNGATAADIEYRYRLLPSGTFSAWTVLAGNTSIANLAVGTYEFESRTIVDECLYSETFTISPIDNITVSGSATSDVSCSGAGDGSLSFSVGSIVLPGNTYSYTVTGGPTVVPAGNTINTSPVSITGLAGGTYTITVTDDLTLCTASTTVTIDEPIALSIDTINITSPLTCIQDAVIEVIVTSGTGTPGYTYTLAGPVTGGPQSSNVFGGLTAGSYTVTVTDSNNCTATDTITIDAVNNPTATIDASSDLCFDSVNQATLDITITPGSSTGPFTYSLNGGAQVAIGGLTFSIPGLTPDSYTIVITDGNGCDVTLTQDIEPQVTITASLIKDLDCGTPSAAQVDITVGGGYAPYTITVNDGSTISTVGTLAVAGVITDNPTAAGTYIYTVTDNEGCVAISNPIEVTPADDPVASAVATDATCNGAPDGSVVITVDATVGVAPYEINFNGLGFSSQTTYGGLTADTYTYIVRDAKECTDTFSVTVGEPTAVVITATEDDIACNPDGVSGNIPGFITVTSIGGGTGPYTLTLLNPDNTAATTTSVNPQVVGAIPPNVIFDGLSFGNYKVRVEDDNRCVYEFDYDIATVADFDITQSTTANCVDGVTANISITGGTGPFQIREFPSGVPIPGAPNGLPVSSGTPNERNHQFMNIPFDTPFVYEVIDTGTNCTAIQTLAPISSPSLMNISVPETDVTCNAAADGLISYTIDSYQGDELTYEVYYTSDLFTDISGTVVFSNGNPETVVLGGVATGTISGFGPGEYLLRVIETGGGLADPCNKSIVFTIEEPTAVSLVLGATTDGNCNALASVVANGQGGTGPYSYEAVVGGAPAPTPPFSITTTNVILLDATVSASWDIYVVDSNGCVAGPENVMISNTVPPVLTAIPPYADCNFVSPYTLSVNATGFGILTYQLNSDIAVTGSIDNNNHEFIITAPGSYTVTVYDGNGCPSNVETHTITEDLELTADFDTEPDCNTGADITAVVTGGSDFLTNPDNFTFVLNGTDINGTGVNIVQDNVTNPGTSNVFVNITAGAYTVTVTDIGVNGAGCSVSTDVSRAYIYPVLTDPAVVEDVSCNGGSDGSILVSLDTGSDINNPFTYQLFDYTGGVTGAQIGTDQVDDPLFDGLAAGEYQVVVTSSFGCSDSLEPIVIGAPSAVSLSTTTTPYGCGSDNSQVLPTIVVTITGGTPDYLISYTGQSVASGIFITVTNVSVVDADPVTAGVQYVIEAIEGGDYDITVTDANGNTNGCIATEPTITIPDFPAMMNPRVDLVDRITCAAPNAEVVTVTVEGGIGPFDFSVVGSTTIASQTGIVLGTGDDVGTTAIETVATFNLPAVGNYVFEIFDQGTGCSILTPDYDVAIFDTIEALIAVNQNVLCFGDATGEISLSVTGYTGAYEYTYTDGTTTTGPIVGNTITNPEIVTGLISGNYTFTVTATDTPFCDDVSNTEFVDEPEALSVVVSAGAPESCDPGDDASYQAVGSGGSGVIEYQLETSGGVIVAPYSYSSVNFFENLDAGDYVVFVRDANGCPASEVFTIAPPNGITIDSAVPNTLLCFGDTNGMITVTASGGNGQLFYSLTNLTTGIESSAQTSNIFTGLVAGDYTVTVTDGLNCIDTLTPVTITEPTEVGIAVEIVREPTCLDKTGDVAVTGSGGTPPYTFSVDGGAYVVGNNGNGPNTHVFTGLVDGPHQFYVRDSNSCDSAVSNTVPINAPDDLALVLDTNNFNVVCFGEATGSVDAVVTGGLGNNQFTLTGTLVSGGVYGPVVQTTSLFVDLEAGDYTYLVESAPDCSISASFTITQSPELIVTVTPEDISCEGEEDGSITVTASGGTPPYFYSLDNNQFFSDDVDGVIGEHVFEDLAAGVYSIYVQDSFGCPYLDPITNLPPEVTIIEPTSIVANEVSIVGEVCAGDNNGEITISLTGGTPPYFTSITAADATDFTEVLDTNDPANVTYTGLPGGTITIYIRDANGCATEYLALIPPGVVLDPSIVQNLLCPVRDAGGLGIVTDEIYQVNVILSEDSVMDNLVYTLTGINGTTQTYSNTTGSFEVDPGEYTMEVIHVSGCSMMISDIVVEEYIPVTAIVVAPTNNPEDPNEYSITVTGGSEPYRYFLSIIDPDTGEMIGEERELDDNLFSIGETALYRIRVLDSSGCDAFVDEFLEFIDIEIPNFFTPDNDGTADFWYPNKVEFFPNLEVSIFDRYGRLLANYMGPQEGWDGVYKGSLLPSGDYWYVIILNDKDKREFTGHFTLYR